MCDVTRANSAQYGVVASPVSISVRLLKFTRDVVHSSPNPNPPLPISQLVGVYAFTAKHAALPVATPAASILPGYLEGLDVATVADARMAQEVCGNTPYGDVGACDGVMGCEYWNGGCGLVCARLATGAACAEASGCAWDELKLHCGWLRPQCDIVSVSTHCTSTKFCTWDSETSSCAAARYECPDLTDEAHCEKSAAPECAWNDLEDGDGDGDGDGDAETNRSGVCADLRQCETINLPTECGTHRGCAYSQRSGSCVSLNLVAEDKAMCVASEDCAIVGTFCNLDFGRKGYCQNCLPLMELGEAVCFDDTIVAAPASGECKRGCFS